MSAQAKVSNPAGGEVVLVHGPPCGGKSTYVDQHADPGDEIIDYDRMAQDAGSPVTHGHSPKYHRIVMDRRNERLRAVEAGNYSGRVWIVSARADATTQFRHDRAVLCDPGAEVCKTRAAAAGRPGHYPELIDDYYTRRSGGRVPLRRAPVISAGPHMRSSR